MQSKARESLPIFCHLCSLLIPCEPMQSPYISPTSRVSTMSHNPMQSLYSRKALQSSYEQKRKSLCLLFCACSLHSYKIPLQSPYIEPTLKVPPHHARLSVSICSVYLCGLGVTFAPLRLALTIGERAVSGYIRYIFCTAGRRPSQWAVQCRHIRRSHQRYTQMYTRRGGDSTAGRCQHRR